MLTLKTSWTEENVTVRAVYENGVLRATQKVDLPDRCQVEVEVRQVAQVHKQNGNSFEGPLEAR
jgi:predicted DNA-binding antitoxin AbrB/MazE fold protein